MSEELDSLEHFGIKGMKWGVVRERGSNGRVTGGGGVGSVVSGIREAKGQLYDKKAGKLRAQVDEIRKANPRGEHTSIAGSERVRKLNQAADKAVLNAERARGGRLTTDEKNVIAGSVMAAAILGSTAGSSALADRLKGDGGLALGIQAVAAIGAGAAYNTIDSGSLNRTANFKKDPSLAAKMSSSQVYDKVVKPINPNYGDFGTMNNCRRATLTYEMRRRGYDVKATKTFTGTGQTHVGILNATGKTKANILTAQFNKDLKSKIKAATASNRMGMEVHVPQKVVNGFPVTDAKSVFKSLSTQPLGSRGEVGLMWLAGGAHSVAYEVFKEGPVIFDTQSGKTFKNAQDLQNRFGNFVAEAGHTRLDNKQLNEDYLQRWAVNA